MNKIQLRKKYKKELKRLIEILKEKYQPLRIYLFGSLTWGGFTLDSDADLLVIKESKKNMLERMQEVNMILADREVPMDILVYTPEEIAKRKKMGDPFILDILKNGKLLYAQSK